MRMTRLLVAGAAAVVLVATAATPSGAVWDPGLGGARGTGPNTELVMSGTGPGAGVTGLIGPVGIVSDPSVPYPTSDPPGFTAERGLRRHHPWHPDPAPWQPAAPGAADVLHLLMTA